MPKCPSGSTGPLDHSATGPLLRWHLRSKGSLAWYELKYGRATCIFTTRSGGVSDGAYRSLNLSYGIGDDPQLVFENRHLLTARCSRLTDHHLVTLRQTHSSTVVYVPEAIRAAATQPPVPSPQSPASAEAMEGDALFTGSPGLALGVKVADCLPIYFFSEDAPVVGLAHAGWRGTLARIAARTVDAITARLEAPASTLLYAFAPCIAASCYEVGPEVADAFRAEFPGSTPYLRSSASIGGYNPLFLDLREANRQILNALGLREVPGLDLCTHCLPDQFFSARRDGATGRNMALIALNE